MADAQPLDPVPEATEQASQTVGESTSPAGEPQPQPQPPSKSIALMSTLTKRQLLAGLMATDTTVHRLDKLVSTAYGEDRALAATGYVSHALHHLLASAPWIAVQTRLGLLARLRQRQKPTTSAPAASPASPSKLLALSSLMSETRYTLRLFGILPLWTWGSQAIKNPHSDSVIQTLTLLQVFVNMIYQILENVGYLASKGIVSKKFIDRWGGIDKWYIWSTRAWFGHIFFQFFVLWRESVLRFRRQQNQGEKSMTDEDRVSLKSEIRAWRKSLVNNIFWAPLCLHWSFEKGVGVPDSMSGFVSFLASAWGFYDIWNGTA